MDDQEFNSKIKKAESLRKKPGLLASLFWGPDYISSGDIFSELAFASESIEDKEKYYNEAANTYLIKKSEYTHFRAGEIYKKLADTFEKHNVDKSLVYLLKYAENLEKAERYLIAGEVYMKIAGKYEDINNDECVKYYNRAYETYKMDSGCPYHVKEALQKCLIAQLKKKDISGAIGSLGALNIKFSRLCRSILSLLLGKVADDDLESVKESELIMKLVNKTGKDCIDALDDFSNEYFLPDYARMIFDMAIERYSPENDIC